MLHFWKQSEKHAVAAAASLKLSACPEGLGSTVSVSTMPGRGRRDLHQPAANTQSLDPGISHNRETEGAASKFAGGRNGKGAQD